MKKRKYGILHLLALRLPGNTAPIGLKKLVSPFFSIAIPITEDGVRRNEKKPSDAPQGNAFEQSENRNGFVALFQIGVSGDLGQFRQMFGVSEVVTYGLRP